MTTEDEINTKILIPGKLVRVKNFGIKAQIWNPDISLEDNINHQKYTIWLEPKEVLLVLDHERMYVYHDVFVYGIKLLRNTQIIGVFSTGVLESVEKFFKEATNEFDK